MRAQRLSELRAAITAIETGSAAAGNAPAPADRAPRARESALGRWLACPGVHEWFGVEGAAEVGAGGAAGGTGGAGVAHVRQSGFEAPLWVPPIAVLLHLARRGLSKGSPRRVVWIGRRCWPYPGTPRADPLLRRSIFVDPPDDAARLWAIDLAARCPAAAVVVADGSGLEMAATRRLQLAAEAGSALVLCARPPGELKRLSAAATRWVVHSAPAPGMSPRWIVELVRCKGARAGPVRVRRWTVEWNRVKRGVVIHAALLERPRAAAQPVARALRSA